jgi:hypothetical protein
MGQCSSTPLVEAPTIQPPPTLLKRPASAIGASFGVGDTSGQHRTEINVESSAVKQSEPHTHVHSTSGGFIVPNEHTPHQISHNVTNSVGTSFSMTSLSRSNTASSRTEPQGGVPGAHTELARLQGRHDVDVRSLPELPPALFLAAIFNDVAFFRAIPVVQSAVRLECRRKRLASSSSSSNGQQNQQNHGTIHGGIKMTENVKHEKSESMSHLSLDTTAAQMSSNTLDSTLSANQVVTAVVPAPESVAVSEMTENVTHEFRSSVLPHLSTVPELAATSDTDSSISKMNLRIVAPFLSRQHSTNNVGLSMDAVTPTLETNPNLMSSPTASSGPGLKEIMCAMDKHGETILHLAAAAGSKDVLELFLTLRPKQASVKCGPKMNTLMHMTALGPAHVAEYYKAVRQHVLHNPDLLAESALDAAKIAVLTDGYAKADSGHDMIDYAAEKHHHGDHTHHLGSLGSFRDTFHRSSGDTLHGAFGSSVRNSILSYDKRNNSHENLADVDKHAMKHPALTHGAGSYISIHNIVSKEGTSSSVIPGLPSHPHQQHASHGHHAATASLPSNLVSTNGVASASSHKIVLHSNTSSLTIGGSDEPHHHQPGAPLILPRSSSSLHAKGHHYSDPLFITGFSYVKALMAYTERFEQDGDYEVEQDHTYEEKECDFGASNTGPRNSPTNMTSPLKILTNASHRLVGIAENGSIALNSNRNSDNDLAETGGMNGSIHEDSTGSGSASSARSIDSAPPIAHDEPISSTIQSVSGQSLHLEPYKALTRSLTSNGTGSESTMIGAFTSGEAKLGHGEDGVIAYLEPTRIFPSHDLSSKALSSLHHHTVSQAGVAAETAFDINLIKASRRFPPRDLLRTVDVLAAHGAPLSLPNKYAITPVDAMQKHREMTSGMADADDSEAHLAGVERGAILRDPPWSLLLKDVAVDWSMVVDRLENKISSHTHHSPLSTTSTTTPPLTEGAQPKDQV